MRSTLDMLWTPLPGGKYEGKTLPQVLFDDPDYFFYQYGPDPRSFCEVRLEADVIAKRAQYIRIPPLEGKPQVAEYLVWPGNHRCFQGIKLMHDTEPLPSGFASRGRKPVFDLSYPHTIAPEDRHASKRLVEQIKAYVLDDPGVAMTRRRCEQFFNDQSKFTQFAIPPGKSY